MSDIESQSVETQREIYTIGYNEGRTRNFQKRSATGDGPGGAGFFSQHLRSGMSLVDCGCGPGGITCGFAEIVAPGAVLGFDVDAGQVAEAKVLAAERKIDNVRLVVGGVYEIDAPDGSFDGAYCQYVLEFLRDPLDALREIGRVLKPGAIVGLVCAEYGGRLIWPVDPLAEEAWSLFMKLWQHNGGDPYRARRLPELLRKTGFTDIEPVVVASTYTRSKETGRMGVGMLSAALEQNVVDQWIALGWMDAQRVEKMRVAVENWSEHPDAFQSLTSCRVLARKGQDAH